MSDVFRFDKMEGFLNEGLPWCFLDAVKHVAMIPLVGMITKLERGSATKKFGRLVEEYPDDFKDLKYHKFPGGYQETPVANVQTVVRMIMLLNGPEAAHFRCGAAQQLVRFLGGDLTLIKEIEATHRIQERLAEENPNHPLRMFGEEVEQQQSKRQKITEEDIHDAEMELRMAEIKAKCDKIKAETMLNVMDCGRASFSREREYRRDLWHSYQEEKDADVRVVAVMHDMYRSLMMDACDVSKRMLIHSIIPETTIPQQESCSSAIPPVQVIINNSSSSVAVSSVAVPMLPSTTPMTVSEYIVNEKQRFSEDTLKSMLKEMSLVGRYVSWYFKRKHGTTSISVKKFCGGEEREIKVYAPEDFDCIENGLKKYCKSRNLPFAS